MQPLNYYLSLLVRRLPLLLAGCVVGAALGWLTTPSEADDPEPVESTYHSATHILIARGPADSVNLPQLAYLTVVGDVPRRAADNLGITPAELTNRVQVSSLPGIQVLQITAYASSEDEAVGIADGLATSLLDELASQREARIAELSAQADALRSERAGVPPGPDAVLELQRIDQEANIVQEQLRQANAAIVPLTSVQAAQAAPISQGAYVAALDSIRTVGSLRSVDPRTDPASVAQAATTTVEPAADSDDGPSRPLRAAVGAFIGLIATAAIAIALDRLDPRIKSGDDAEDVLAVPVLAQVPAIERSQRGDHVVVHRQPNSRFAESFRTLRTATAHSSSTAKVPRPSALAGEPLNGGGAGGSVILLTAPEPGDGTTTCAVNLAAAFAEAGKRVVLIDADFRTPRTQKFLRPSSPATLADALWPAARPASPDPSHAVDYGSLVSPTELLGLGLLRAADAGSVIINPSRLLVAVNDAATWAARHFDVVVIDTAPLLSVNDASDLLPSADTVVLVVRSGSTTRETAAQASELLHRLDARFAGSVLNEATGSSGVRRTEPTRPVTSSRPAKTPAQREALRL